MTELAVQCVACKLFTLRPDRFKGDAKGLRLAREMASAGCGMCALDPKETFVSPTYPRACADHKPEDPAIVAKRIAWLNKPPVAHETP